MARPIPASLCRQILVVLCLVTTVTLVPLLTIAQPNRPDINPTPPVIDPLRGDDHDSVTLEKITYFLDPDGRYIIASPGLYLVRTREDVHLVLIPNRGRQTLVVQAHATAHEERLAEPVALTVEDQQNAIHIILLEPGGKGLDALGAATPMRLRSVEAPALTAEQVHQAFTKMTTGGQPTK